MTLQQLPDDYKLVDDEEKVVEHWRNNDTFQQSLKQNKDNQQFVFLDGPPFINSLPHHGHYLVGIIKDIVTRYQTMSGKYVHTMTGKETARVAGWDCHGVPMEMSVNKILGIHSTEEIEQFGIGKYNDECRKLIKSCSDEWAKQAERIGRWIDFDNAYKTCDTPFMETVWWVFKTMFDKGLIYRGYKVMPYSTGCATPLSNFEATQEYTMVKDPSITVSFPLEDDDDTLLLVWTTTPWTLPSNLALCVNPTIEYVKIFDDKTKKFYILSKNALDNVFPVKTKSYTIVDNFLGADIEGTKYTPMFDYFVNGQPNRFTILVDEYVKDDTGTGIVHQAPAFGADDFRVCIKYDIVDKKGSNMVCPIDLNGKFTKDIPDLEGVFFKDADDIIVKMIKDKKRMIINKKEEHNYPFCYRTHQPLMMRAVDSWFVDVSQLKDDIVENNKKIHWVPETIGKNRFHNWLENATDWCISRTRYWGTPMPIWVSDDFEEIVCIGSIQELSDLSGVPLEQLTDLHREHIDHITIPSKTGKGQLKRLSDTLDCWFESGSMPYGQCHYPFENKEQFEKCFPADFICEALDQTRGWFYTLLVISTALFNKPAFKNVICSGLILAEDGTKMSKSKQNFTDPRILISKYGADAFRLYLINSQVVKAEPMQFVDDKIGIMTREVLIPWYNAYKFFVESYKMSKIELDLSLEPTNIMDVWILAKVNELVSYFKQEMDCYRLYTIVPKLFDFIEHMNNWYVRMNKDRFKGKVEDEQKISLSVLYRVLYNFTILMAPFTPFKSESIYQNLKNLLPNDKQLNSVHYCNIPNTTESVNYELLHKMDNFQKTTNVIRSYRSKNNISFKLPIKKVIVCHKDKSFKDDIENLKEYILSETHILELNTDNIEKYVSFTAHPNFKNLGQRFKKDAPKFANLIKQIDKQQIDEFITKSKITVLNETLTNDDLNLIPKIENAANMSSVLENDILILFDLTQDDNTTELYNVRCIKSTVQKMRKELSFKPWDKVIVYLNSDEELIIDMMNRNLDDMSNELLSEVLVNKKLPNVNLTQPIIMNHGVVNVSVQKE